MVVENEESFLPKPKPITDLKKDFKLLGRWCIYLKWSLFEPKNLCCALATIEALNIWIFKYVTLVSKVMVKYLTTFAQYIIIQTGQWRIFFSLPLWGEISYLLQLTWILLNKFHYLLDTYKQRYTTFWGQIFIQCFCLVFPHCRKWRLGVRWRPSSRFPVCPKYSCERNIFNHCYTRFSKIFQPKRIFSIAV